MKKKLLKPPDNDKSILMIPEYNMIKNWLANYDRIITSHQPYFFNPGVSLKFSFLDLIEAKNKKIIFLDTDTIKLVVKIPIDQTNTIAFTLVNSQEIMDNFKTPDISYIKKFLVEIEEILENHTSIYNFYINNFKRFKNIFIENSKKYSFLKDVLVESFLEYYRINLPVEFFSNIIKNPGYENFTEYVIKNHNSFRKIFNESLDIYKKEYRFRFKNFPYPKLDENELPFWILKGNNRQRCFIKDIDKDVILLPRSVLITTYMRLYITDIFIHGTGGANYEPLHDWIITKFFKFSPKPYCIISGTFYISNIPFRDIPYFLISPEEIRSTLSSVIKESNH